MLKPEPVYILITIWNQLFQPNEKIIIPIVYSISFFILLIIAMILLIYILRIKKIYYHNLRSTTQEKFNRLLTAALSRVEENHTQLTSFSAERMISIHKLENSFSDTQKQYILEEIINYFRNVKGNYKEILYAFYYKLGLLELSRKKLRSKEKTTIVKGIRELSNMDIYIPWNDIIRLMKKNDPYIREELLYTLAKQSPERLLYYLEYRHHYFTIWDEINIHAAYKNLEGNKLPKFSKWFFSVNQRIAVFCIKMTGEFQQQSSLLDIPELLTKTKNPLKILAALSVVEKMEAAELSNNLLHILYKWIENEEIVYRVLLTIEKLMDAGELAQVIGKLSSYPSFRVGQLIDHIHLTSRIEQDERQKKIIKMIKQAS